MDVVLIELGDSISTAALPALGDDPSASEVANRALQLWARLCDLLLPTAARHATADQVATARQRVANILAPTAGLPTSAVSTPEDDDSVCILREGDRNSTNATARHMTARFDLAL
jgi:hypothetical protein